MRILVTGGAGFIGSHLCERLLGRGDEVICVDNFFTGRRENVVHLLMNPYFELIRHDIVHPLTVEVDQIYNLACPASPIHYQFNAIKTIKTCTVGVVNMLGLAKRTGARILQASTSEVYGDPLEHPQTESYWGNVNPIGYRSCYDEGKRVAETLFMDYHRQNEVDIRIARIFNTYGPRMAPSDGRVVSNVIMRALADEQICIFGDGCQTRSFCYIDDLLNGLIALMNTENVTGPINLGNPEEFTINQLVSEVLDQTQSSSKIVHLDPLPDDPKQRKPDISLAKKVLNWLPMTHLNVGLEKTIPYFEQELLKLKLKEIK